MSWIQVSVLIGAGALAIAGAQAVWTGSPIVGWSTLGAGAALCLVAYLVGRRSRRPPAPQ